MSAAADIDSNVSEIDRALDEPEPTIRYPRVNPSAETRYRRRARSSWRVNRTNLVALTIS